MNKALVIVITAALLMAGGVWAFFHYGGQSPEKDASSSIERTQDERLTRGVKDAPVTIVEYADVLCPYCAKSHRELLPKLMDDYIDKGLVRYEIRLVEINSPDSKRAATGAYCAAEQDKFWDYMGAAYDRSWSEYYSKNMRPTDVTLFSEAGIEAFAKDLPLDTLIWSGCVRDDGYAQTIADNLDDMRKMEATGTPTFLIDGKKYSGAPPYSVIKALVDKGVRQAEKS